MRFLAAFFALAALTTIPVAARAQSSLIIEVSQPDPVDSSKTVLEVRNDRSDDMVVYVVHGGLPTELGVVHALSKGSFNLPKSVTRARSTIRFTVRPFGSQATMTSRDVIVEPGDRIQMRIMLA